MDTDKAIAKNLSWLETMKQENGYSGPVSHYWGDSLNYIGPATDWRYEGIVAAFLTLFEKTGEKKFLIKAIGAGNNILKNQKPSSAFYNSGFEANPSFQYSSMPHESAVVIALLLLVAALKKQKIDYRKYFNAAKKNIDAIHLKSFFDENKKTFLNYEKERAKKVENKFVPNKIATACEALLLLYKLTKEKRYLDYALSASDTILQLQDKHDFFGGIYQSNLKEKIITFYTARCMPALLELYKISKREEYREAAESAGEFIEKMYEPERGFIFGYMQNEDGKMEKYYFPIFIAGSADVVRALIGLNRISESKKKNYVKFVLDNQDKNGGFRTAFGLNRKNKLGDYRGKPSWRDVLHVVGWNDKTLRLLSNELGLGTELDSYTSGEIKIKCSDGDYYENENYIKVEGEESYFFDKKKYFSNNAQTIKRIVYEFTLRQDGLLNLVGRAAFKLAGRF